MTTQELVELAFKVAGTFKPSAGCTASNVAHRPLRLQPSIIGAVILMIWIGLPMVAIIGRYLRRQRPLPRHSAESGGFFATMAGR
jgi:hypothetical protein